MRFSPERKPSRSRKPPAKEVLDVTTPEEEFTFDPETDISEETWKTIEADLEKIAEEILTTKGTVDGLVLLFLTKAHVVGIVSPHRLDRFRTNTRLKKRLVEILLTQPTQEIGRYCYSLNELVWTFPELRQDVIEARPVSLLRTFQAYAQGVHKVDQTVKQQVIDHLEKVEFGQPAFIDTAVFLMEFLVNFFPDGRQIIQDLMQKTGTTQSKIVNRFFLRRTDSYGRSEGQIMTGFALLFPTQLEAYRQDRAFMTSLRQMVTVRQAEMAQMTHLASLLLYDILSAQDVTFDSTGIHLERKQKSLQPKRELPARDQLAE